MDKIVQPILCDKSIYAIQKRYSYVYGACMAYAYVRCLVSPLLVLQWTNYLIGLKTLRHRHAMSSCPYKLKLQSLSRLEQLSSRNVRYASKATVSIPNRQWNEIEITMCRYGLRLSASHGMHLVNVTPTFRVNANDELDVAVSYRTLARSTGEDWVGMRRCACADSCVRNEVNLLLHQVRANM